MKLLALLLTSTLALSGLVGVAHASSTATQAVPYHYGMHLDIAKVLSITEPTTMDCQVIRAQMKYIDSRGQPEEISYSKLSDACSNQG